jgi:hypothetical protein
LVGKLKERAHLEDLGIDVGLILKLVLKKQDDKESRQGKVVGSSEHVNEFLDLHKMWEFLS